MSGESQNFNRLRLLADMVPAPFYWAYINCVVLGFNRSCIELARNLSAQKSANNFCLNC